MRVLWLSNCPLIESDITSSGTWIQSMAEGLIDSKKIELAVIALSDVQSFQRQDYCNVPQWLVPSRTRLGKNGLPEARLMSDILNVCEWYQPNIVHVWGVECFWGLLTARGYIKTPALLEMQGLKSACAQFYTADLTSKEIFRCIGIKEILKRKCITSYKNEFAAWGEYENEIISGHKFIDIQSEWMSAQVKAINCHATQYTVDLALRAPFYSALPWKPLYENNVMSRHNIFFSASGPVPYKGLHVAIRALSKLAQEFPNIRLRVAGKIQYKGIRQEGYVRWLNKLSKQLKVNDRIDWLGSLNANQIISELQCCSVNLVCSFVESYCLALAEPMYLGVPCVTSFTGGTSWLAEHGKSALFFTPGDSLMCAFQITRVLKDTQLEHNLSINSKESGMKRHNLFNIVQRQLDIYKQLLIQ